jgi:hypothetical protein
MGDTARSARRGAPVTHRRRIPMGIRVTPELRDELVARAEASGRSITQEMELLLEQALSAEELLGGPRTAALLRILAETAKFCQGIGGPEDEWLDDRSKFNEVVDAWNRHLEEIKPKEPEADRIQRQEEMKAFREAIAKAGAEDARALRDWAARNSTSAILDPEERAEWAEMARSGDAELQQGDAE